MPEEPVTRPGDIWTMGPHRLVCGDATDPQVIRRALDGGLADMVFADPPYNVAYRKGKVRKAIANDDLGSGFGAFLEAACRAMVPVTKGAIYICISGAEIDVLKAAFAAAGGHWSTFSHLEQGPSSPSAAPTTSGSTSPSCTAGAEGSRALLVRRPRPGRCLADRPAKGQRSPSDHEADCAGRAGDPQLVEDKRHRPRPVCRLGDDA